MAGILNLIGRAVDDLVKMGYPESVAKRISSGELPMDDKWDLISRKEDFLSQGNMPYQLYHWTGSDFNEFIPSERGKYGAGVYLSPDKWYGEKYVMGGTPKRMDVVQNAKIARMQDINQAEEGARARMAQMQYEPYQFNDAYWRAIQDELKDQGFGGLEFGKELVVFDPKNIRSVNAAFDPEYTGSNILGSRMAPTAGAGLLGILGLTEEDLK